jgi:hypothetical protein
MDLLSSIELPHWLMIAGAVLVVVGLIGLAFRKNYAESVENNPKQAAPTIEPNPKGPRRPRGAAWDEREADREQAKREAEYEGQRGLREPNKLDPTPGATGLYADQRR